MTTRRKFIKASVAGASLATGSSVLAQMASSVPAVNSLLLDDDSSTLECSDVNVADFSCSLSYTGAGGAVNLQLETPNGSRILADGAPATISGNCNDWAVSGTSGGLESRTINLQGMTVNTGRYPIFMTTSASVDIFVNLNARADGNEVGSSGDVQLIANEERLIGSINVSDTGQPVVRILESSLP